jgi:hypothetical protein
MYFIARSKSILEYKAGSRGLEVKFLNYKKEMAKTRRTSSLTFRVFDARVKDGDIFGTEDVQKFINATFDDSIKIKTKPNVYEVFTVRIRIAAFR